MTFIVILFGLLIFIIGVIIIFNPEIVFGLIRHNAEKVELHILAVVIRLAIGVLLILNASESRYPIVIEIIGWLSIAAAATFSVIGRRNFLALISWALSLVKRFGRVGGFIAIIFGGFLIHSFI